MIGKDMFKKFFDFIFKDKTSKKVSNNLENLISKLKKPQKQILKETLETIIFLNWHFVIIEKETFNMLLKNSEDLKSIKKTFKLESNNNKYEKILNLNNQSKKPNSKFLDNFIPSSTSNFYYYEDDDTDYYSDSVPYSYNNNLSSLNSDLKSDINNLNNRFKDQNYILGLDNNNFSSLEGIDTIYNYAVIYIYGNKKNNIVTIYDVGSDDSLYTCEQRQFTINTYTDAIEMCDLIIKEFDLDAIFFIDTSVTKKMLNYINNGLEKNIKIDTIKEYIDFKHYVNNSIVSISKGNVFVSYGSWLDQLQKEIQGFFILNDRNIKLQTSSQFPRLKSFAYGINLWENNKDSDFFVRDFGTKNDKTD